MYSAFIAAFLLLAFLSIFAFLWQRKRFLRTKEDNQRILLSYRRIYEIILEDLDFETVVKKVANIIPQELKFGTGVLSILDEKQGVIRRVAASQTPEAEKAIELIESMGIPFRSISISITDPNNLMAKSLRDKKPYITTNVFDVLGPVLNREQAKKVQEVMSTKTTFVYPIFMKDRPLGVFIASTNKERSEIAEFEIEILNNFVNFVGLSLQNAKLFTSLKETSQELKIANEKLKELDKLKDDFVSIASHELRTPMTAIKSYLWMALYRGDVKLTEKMGKYLNRAYISTERLINLVNDMLNVSRIESGRIEIAPKAFDIPGLVTEVLEEVKPKADERQVKLEIGKTQVPQVFADPDKVHQILLNLLGNALKFTPVGGLISINFFSDGLTVETAVKDTGVGISEDDLSRLFRKFERLDNSYVAAATSGGTGLGLYISRSLVELMKGKIWATSEGLNKGTTFTFSLPAATPGVLNEAGNYTKKPTGEVKTLEPVVI